MASPPAPRSGARVVAAIAFWVCLAVVAVVVAVVGPRLLSAEQPPTRDVTATGSPTAEPVDTDALIARLRTLCATGRCATPKPRLASVTCLDLSGSVPKRFVSDGRRMVARHVASLVRGATGGATIYLRTLDARSYEPRSGKLRREISAVGPPPAEPVLPKNPYDAKVRAERERAYAADVARWLAAYDRSVAAARKTAEDIRRLRLRRTKYGTDVAGCALRAQDLLAGSPNRELILVTDLKPQGRQSKGKLRLAGVRVVVAYWCTDSATHCARRRDTFTRLVRRAGAASVTFLDPLDLRSFA